MIAIYHSHPDSIPFPSETDVNMAFYPEVSSIIISLKERDNPVGKSLPDRERGNPSGGDRGHLTGSRP